jgi:hypothetical protein
VQPEPGVVVLVAVVVEEVLAEHAGVVDVVEVVGEGRAVLESFERGLAEWVVVAHVGPGMAAGDIQIDEQLGDGLAGHRGAPVGVHRLRLAVDPNHVID